VTSDTGEKIGHIEDLLLDGECHRAVGVLVSGGLLSKQRVVPLADVQTVGADAVLVKTGANVVDAREWLERGVGSTRAGALYGKHVVAADGAAVGSISGIVVNDATGQVSSLEVAVPGRGYRTRHVLVAMDESVPLTRDVVVTQPERVSEDAARGPADQV
jgi:uncharacterized protein YrrD